MTESDALSLVNSLINSRGRLVDRLPQWADERGYHDLEQLRSLRVAARSVIAAAAGTGPHEHDDAPTGPEPAIDEPTAVRHLNDISRAGASWLEWNDGQLVEHTSASPSAQALAHVARGAMLLAFDASQGLLRPCGAPGCVQFFRVEGHRRSWCSEACGNRARVARHARNRRDA